MKIVIIKHSQNCLRNYRNSGHFRKRLIPAIACEIHNPRGWIKTDCTWDLNDITIKWKYLKAGGMCWRGVVARLTLFVTNPDPGSLLTRWWGFTLSIKLRSYNKKNANPTFRNDTIAEIDFRLGKLSTKMKW